MADERKDLKWEKKGLDGMRLSGRTRKDVRRDEMQRNMM